MFNIEASRQKKRVTPDVINKFLHNKTKLRRNKALLIGC